ncbi:hypothetical protein FH972_025505 [Carpinus fangiana]|uniref:Photolyase/cryptochrome alpha/beta domain-containing protein n=1 Tax=Carpinus fangiana TaxID=176857 RepID=A0A5N6L1U2_9ROSI|nr:hypothetical protein FH972_025505 [Carpinus fangiana]
MAAKRKVVPLVNDSSGRPAKNVKYGTNINPQHQYNLDHSRVAEEYGIINRTYYPPQIALSQCHGYVEGTITTPMGSLQTVIQETADQRATISTGKSVVHWFKRDLRLHDNRALSLASAKARTDNVALICIFLISPQDYEAHLTSSIQVDFQFRSLQVLKTDLEELNIPLFIQTVEKRRNVPQTLKDACKKWSAHHIFCNIEYEVDELRREAILTTDCLTDGINLTAVHDTCVVPPGTLLNSQNEPFTVYSPWHRAWNAKIDRDPSLLHQHPRPQPNPPSSHMTYESIFKASVPSPPSNKSLTPDKKMYFASLWPAGEHEAHVRLQSFLADKVSKYRDHRSFPAANVNSLLSVHLAAGTLSVRTAVAAACEADTAGSRRLDEGTRGTTSWISELAWRDFYKHILVAFPFVCMNAAFKPAYVSRIAWSYDSALFEAWKAGRTGYPFVDAAMRQLATTGTMHNRARMVVASFLSKDLLIDWRLGEQHFMLSLADGDFASNNGGWGFSVGCGVDPQPYMRLFNPILQSEKFDAKGEYIRKWVEELRDVEGKEVHDPYGRGNADVVKRMMERGYPRMIVEHKKARERAIRVFGEGLQSANKAGTEEHALASDTDDIDHGYLPG